METNEQVKLRFHGVQIIKVDFTSFKVFDSQKKINVDIETKVIYPKGYSNRFDILMRVDLNAEENFELSLDAIGSFEASADIIKGSKLHNMFVNANAPAIMFPYIRSFITTFTSNLGKVTGSINIPTRFFKGEIEELIPGNEIKELDEQQENPPK